MSYLSLFSISIIFYHHLLLKSTMMRLWSKRTSSLVLHKVITPNYHKVLKYIPVSQSSDETKNINLFLTAIVGSSILYASREDKEDAKCCGIVGVVNSKAKENEIKETLLVVFLFSYLGGMTVLVWQLLVINLK